MIGSSYFQSQDYAQAFEWFQRTLNEYKQHQEVAATPNDTTVRAHGIGIRVPDLMREIWLLRKDTERLSNSEEILLHAIDTEMWKYHDGSNANKGVKDVVLEVKYACSADGNPQITGVNPERDNHIFLARLAILKKDYDQAYKLIMKILRLYDDMLRTIQP